MPQVTTMYRVTLTKQVHAASELHLERMGEQWFTTEGAAFDYALDNTFNGDRQCVRAHIDRFPTYNTGYAIMARA